MSDKNLLAARTQHLQGHLADERARNDVALALARASTDEIALRRHILEEQLTVITKPTQFKVEGQEGVKADGAKTEAAKPKLSTQVIGLDGVGKNGLGIGLPAERAAGR